MLLIAQKKKIKQILTIMYQENEKNYRNFDTVELEICSFPKDFPYVP